MKSILMTLLTITSLSFSAFASKIMNNRGFESGDFAGWKTAGQGWEVSSNIASEGRMSAMCSVKKGETAEIRACIQKINNVFPGKRMRLSVDVMAIAVTKTPNSRGSIVILCTNAEGSVLKEYRHDLVRPKAQFQNVVIENAVVPEGTVETHLMLVVEGYQLAADGDWWRFDNVNIQID